MELRTCPILPFGFIRIPLGLSGFLCECIAFFLKTGYSIFKAKEIKCLPSLSGVLLFWVQLAEICGDKSYKTSFWVWSSDMDFSTLLFMLVTNLVSVWWDKKEDEHPCLCCLWVRCHCCLTISKTVQTFFCGRRPLYHRIILSHGN